MGVEDLKEKLDRYLPGDWWDKTREKLLSEEEMREKRRRAIRRAVGCGALPPGHARQAVGPDGQTR